MSRMIRELLILLLVLILAAGVITYVHHLIVDGTEEPPVGEVPAGPEHVHKPGNPIKENPQPATCTDSGFYTEVIKCSCGEIISSVVKSEAPLGHKMVGNECSRGCGYIVDSVGFKYELINGTYTITGIGSNADTHVIIPATHEGLPVSAIADGVFAGKSVKIVEIPDSVSSIGDKAFENCASLTDVVLGESVIHVGMNAFNGCKALKLTTEGGAKYLGSKTNAYLALISAESEDITECTVAPDTKVIASGAFADCGKLREIVIPDRVKTVGERAFYDCTNLLKVTLGKSLTSIESEAFLYCHKLIEVYNLTTEIAVNCGLSANGYVGYYALDVYKTADAASKIGADADGFVFYDNGSDRYIVAYHGANTVLSLPSDGKAYEMYSHAFSRLDIEEVTIPVDITSIGTYAFRDCEKLTSVELHDNLTAIESGAFKGCAALGSIELPSTVNVIGSHAFEGCKALTTITVPAGVQFIDSYVFMNCEALAEVNMGSKATKVGEYAFYGCSVLGAFDLSKAETVGDYAFYGCALVKAADLSSAKTIGNYAFRNSGLTKVNISSVTTSVGEQAFAGCAALQTVDVADRTVSLTFGDSAFADCINLKSANIGTKVGAISEGMFRGCTALTDVTLGAGVSKIGDRAFFGCKSLLNVNLDRIVTIGNGAFADCIRFSKLVFGSKITTIGERAFENCYNIMEVTIPATVTSLGNEAFLNCVKLVEIYFFSNVSAEDYEASHIADFALNTYFADFHNTKIVVSGDFVFYVNGNTRYLVGYQGADDAITLPANVNGKSYEILPYAFYRFDALKSVDFGGASVTKIGAYAFAECTSLEKVEMSDSVQSVASHAFYHCTGLADLTLSANLATVEEYAFNGCSALTDVNLGNAINTIGKYAFADSGLVSVNTGSASSIGEYAFANNNNLSSVVIDGAVSYVGDYAFNGCSSLATLAINAADETVIGIGAFKGTALTVLTLPEGVKTVKADAFSGVSSISEINIPKTLVNVADTAFFATSPDVVNVADGHSVYATGFNCLYNVETRTVELGSNKAVIPENARFIADNAFYKCTSLTAADLNAIVKIGQGAFEGCTKLVDLTIGTNLINLGKNAFKNCQSITSVALHGGLTVVSEGAFASCTSLTSVTLGAGIETIGANAFSGCSKMTTLTLSKGLKTIGDSAFSRCEGLTYLVIPEGTETIGNNAFSDCKSIETVVIGEGLTFIGTGAFQNCSALAKIYVPNTLLEVGANAFNGCSALKDVYYDGDKKQFDAINVGSGNDKFKKATRTYTK